MLKALKENLALLSLMVVLVGTSSTDSYYSTFGLKYQFLNIPASHILFRGLTAVWAFPVLAVLYALALALVAGQSRLVLLLGGLDRVQWSNHAAVAIFITAAWFGGEFAGFKTAVSDMTADTSSLPLIVKIDLKDTTSAPAPLTASEGYRLLLQGSDGARIFKAVGNPRTESPLVRYISTGAINAITVCARC